MTMNDQASSLRKRMFHLSDTVKRGRTIAIVSGKGGVGKSNFALNFSLELIQQGKKVIIIDLDVGMGNIDILLGLQAKNTILDLLEKRLPIEEVIETADLSLSYLSGGSGFTQLFTLDEASKEYFFHQYEKLSSQYDYIIFDMGAGATDESLSFILASDECIVITTPEPTSLMDAYSMIKFIIHKNDQLPISLVMNKSPSTALGKKYLNQFQMIIQNFLTIQPKKLGILPDDPIVSKAVMRQMPYILYKENAQISKAMKKIVHNYLGKSQQTKKRTHLSFLDRLKQLLKER